MTFFYSNERNVQVVIYLLKAHGIRHVIASPGSTNTSLVASIQNDQHFKIYSSVDERSAAYMACGLAAELGEPVVISCTGATASRNYLPGLTEAYFRKLPILAITSTQPLSRVGHHVAQVIDRSSVPNDAVRFSVALPVIKDDDDLWDCEVKVNKAILELKHHGGGPVHINLPTTYSKPYSTKELPVFRVIDRITLADEFPPLSGKVAVFVGSRRSWKEAEVRALEMFCESNDAVVFCDHTSGYRGRYRVQYALAAAQEMLDNSACRPDVMIHVGEVTGDYASLSMAGKTVWRVSEDGEVRDTFRRLRYVFEMSEQAFFERYSRESPASNAYLLTCREVLESLRSQLPELPFSNVWLASRLAHCIPPGSVVHFGILNSLRSWNFFELPESVSSSSNVGGFGIDGSLSTLVGASLSDPARLYFCVIGDLAFFYDMNVMGNRHVGKNLRVILVNNGRGTEFRLYDHHTAYFGEAVDEFVAAAGHFGNKSAVLVRNYAEALGFEYMSASNKQEIEAVAERFLSPELFEKPVLLEVFTDSEQESLALKMIHRISVTFKGQVKRVVKDTLGPGGVSAIKSLIKS